MNIWDEPSLKHIKLHKDHPTTRITGIRRIFTCGSTRGSEEYEEYDEERYNKRVSAAVCYNKYYKCNKYNKCLRAARLVTTACLKRTPRNSVQNAANQRARCCSKRPIRGGGGAACDTWLPDQAHDWLVCPWCVNKVTGCFWAPGGGATLH